MTLFLLQLFLGATAAGLTAWLFLSIGEPRRTNYRGRAIPSALGIALIVALCWAVPLTLVVLAVRGEHPAYARYLAILLGTALVFAAGLYDDLQPARTRGVLPQIKLVLRGRITSGVVKLVVIVAASVLVSFAIARLSWRSVAAIPVLAGSANLWNLLDVRPGRSMKALVLADAGLVGAIHDPHFEAGVLLAIALGAGLALLAVDLRERAMLGDSGANVLGFLVGLALFLTLRTWALVVAAAVIVVLHVLAETVTLSRLIDAAPPLRWLDRLGRAEVEEPPRGPDPLIP